MILIRKVNQAYLWNENNVGAEQRLLENNLSNLRLPFNVLSIQMFMLEKNWLRELV